MSLSIPSEWPSDLYRFDFVGLSAEPVPIRFVVRSRWPGRTSRILVMLPSNTYQAYNGWGGKSLYPSDGPERSHRVSFDRPAQAGYDLGGEQLEFIRWLRRERIPVEYCANEDLHGKLDPLVSYRLLVSLGHDEYWSKTMRDRVEAFIARGGNVAYLSGNVCWYQIRYEARTRQMVCYKDAALDPLTGVDDAVVTVNWRECPVNRPENHMTGVSFAHGGGSWLGGDYSNTPYVVRAADHWVFEGTGLSNGVEFGGASPWWNNAVGYEADGAEYFDDGGVLRARGGDGSPSSFRVLATADLSSWAPWGWSAGPHGTTGQATMGIYRRGGTVFTAASTGWPGALEDFAVARITRNVLTRLSSSSPSPDLERPDFRVRAWERIGHAHDVTAMAATQGTLFAATSHNELWSRPSVGWEIRWDRIGDANMVTAMAAIDGKLFAATTDGGLWWRDPVGHDIDWERIGHANMVTAMAAIDGKLYAATTDGGLWWRDPVGHDIDWERIGHANMVTAMAAIDGKLYAATTDGGLWWRDPVGHDIDWERIGHAHSVCAMAATCSRLYGVDVNGDLWRRESRR